MFICLLFTIRDTLDRLYGCMYHVYTGSPLYKVYCTRIRPHRKAETKSYHFWNTLISKLRSCWIPNTLSSPAVASVTSSRSPIYGLFMFLLIFFVLAIPIVLGQNYTACNPTTNSNCPPIPGFSSATTSFNFSSTYPERDFMLFSENTITQGGGGLHMMINAVGEYPYIETNSTVSPGSF